MLAPSNAGNLAIFKASCGSTRAKDIDLTAGTLCIELAPKGHCWRLPSEGVPSTRSSPLALAVAERCRLRRVVMPLRVRGAHLAESARPLITVYDQSFAVLGSAVASWCEYDQETVLGNSDNVASGGSCADGCADCRTDLLRNWESRCGTP
jgi:hypothetical protein